MQGTTAEPERAGERGTTTAAVDEGALDEFSGTAEARRLAEMEADQELLARIMYAGYRGPDWERVAERLVAYGVAVLAAWIWRGQIYERCRARGYRLMPLSFSKQEAADLAADTVTIALGKFIEQVLIPNRWDPRRGASLKTFFVGQCLIRYPNEHRRAMAERRRAAAFRPAQDGPPLSDVADPGGSSTEGQALARLAIDRALDGADPRTRLVVELRAQGWRWDEIAEVTGLNVAAAKSRLHRLQKEQHGQP